MRRYLVPAVMAVSLLAGQAFAAASDSGETDQQHAVPVLVNVNAEGKVTLVDPAVRFRPGLSLALEKTVKAMISGPAVNNGEPIASQFVLILAVTPANKDTDSGEFKFSYLSTRTVPPGTWHWATKDHMGGQHFALASDQGGALVNNFVMPSTMYEPRNPNAGLEPRKP